MTPIELRELMFASATEDLAEYDAKLTSLASDAKTERKALTIQKNITQNSAGFLNYDFGGRYFEVRENIVFRQTNSFSHLKPDYDALDGSAKRLFLTYAYALFMVTKNFYEPRIKQVECETNAAKLFEARLIVGTVGEILDKWQSIWAEHGVIRCEVSDA